MYTYISTHSYIFYTGRRSVLTKKRGNVTDEFLTLVLNNDRRSFSQLKVPYLKVILRESTGIEYKNRNKKRKLSKKEWINFM